METSYKAGHLKLFANPLTGMQERMGQRMPRHKINRKIILLLMTRNLTTPETLAHPQLQVSLHPLGSTQMYECVKRMMMVGIAKGGVEGVLAAAPQAGSVIGTNDEKKQ